MIDFPDWSYTVTELAVLFVMKHLWELEGKCIALSNVLGLIYEELELDYLFMDDDAAWNFIQRNREELAPLFDNCVRDDCLNNPFSLPNAFCNLCIQDKINELFKGYAFWENTPREERVFTIKDIMRAYKHLAPEIEKINNLPKVRFRVYCKV